MTVTMHTGVWGGSLYIHTLRENGKVLAHSLEFSQNNGRDSVSLFMTLDQMAVLTSALELYRQTCEPITTDLPR